MDLVSTEGPGTNFSLILRDTILTIRHDIIVNYFSTQGYKLNKIVQIVCASLFKVAEEIEICRCVNKFIQVYVFIAFIGVCGYTQTDIYNL